MLVALFVVFVVVMLLWGLARSGAITANTDWLAFVAVLVLGAVVFLVGAGVVVVDRAPVR